jgi:hypothetical protein
MGTDIHMIAQRRESPDHPWQTVDLAYECPDCEGSGKQTFKHHVTKADVVQNCYWCDGTGTCKRFRDRCYNLFAQLADVRNGTGFAGVDTGEGFLPIAPQRGLPEGCDNEEGEFGDHSFSWLTLAELEAYDLDRVTVCRGIVDRKTYEAWDRKGSPDNWCGGISGPDVKIITDAQARAGEPGTYVKIAWARTYRQAGGNFWKLVLPSLQRLGTPENVRIVFGFDS